MKIIIAMIIGAIFFPIFMEEFISNISNIGDRLKIFGYIIKYVPGAVVGMAGYLIYSEFKINEELIDLKKSVLQIKESKGMQLENFDDLSDEIISVKPNDNKDDEK